MTYLVYKRFSLSFATTCWALPAMKLHYLLVIHSRVNVEIPVDLTPFLVW